MDTGTGTSAQGGGADRPDATPGARSPVSPGGERVDDDATALCLSGGGYRAMVFHAGVLRRLNELGQLLKLTRVSSVSGGSIAAGVLAMNWHALQFDGGGVATNLDQQVIAPIRGFAGRTIDESAIFEGLLLPGSVADKAANAYRDHLFHDTTLQDLTDEGPGVPRFVFNATNVMTGDVFRFSKPFMADYKVGVYPRPAVRLATAVAASAAFPPVLSPLKLDLDPHAVDTSPTPDGTAPPLGRPPFTTRAVLTDGGVYDNLGLETAWKRCKTVLVSDGGGQMGPEEDPHRDWARHAIRINAIIDNQVRNLRKRQIVEGFQRGDRAGAYWGIRGHVADYGPVAGALPCPPQQTLALAQIATRLEAMDDTQQERLMNWGYAICDVAMRRWMLVSAAPPAGFPYPGAGLG